MTAQERRPRVLYERDDELASLHGLHAETLSGATRFAVVSGPAGCGKTELLRTFAAEAVAAGALRLSAAASRSEHLVPFGVWTQLCRSAGSRFRVDACPELPAGALPEEPRDGSVPLSADIIRSVCLPLLDVIEHAAQPVVIDIDDFQHADAVSLQCLAAVARRLGGTPLLVVLGEASDWPSAQAALQAELPLEPLSRRLRLRPLTPPGVRALMEGHLGPLPARRLAERCGALTAGNPLLVRGVIADNVRGAQAPFGLCVDSGYAEAVLSCLHRCGPVALTVARHVALLGEPAGARLLGRLSGVDTKSVESALETLHAAGVLSDGRFGHPRARTAVLDNMTPQERSRTRARIAAVLYRTGAAPLTVARQVLASHHVSGGAWAPALLDEAARQALREGMPDLARDCLTHARELGTDDEKLRASITATLFDVEWRTDPCAALRALPSLAAASRSGALTGVQAALPVTAPLWFGDVTSAVDTLERLVGSGTDAAAVSAEHLQASRLWLRLGYPAAAGTFEAVTEELGGAPPLSPQLQGVLLLSRLSSDGPDAALVDEAERLLRRHRLTERNFAVLVSALLTLVFADRLEQAEESVKRLAAQAEALAARTWRAVFTALHAEIALRRGDLAAASWLAQASLSVIPTESWGVGIGMPLATLIQVGVASGKLSAALRALQTPVPDEMFQTPIGLHYMLARGHYLLAAQQHRAAFDEFRTIGELAREWKTDVPALVPWRSGAAAACLRLGRLSQARELARAQVDLCADPEQARARAAALRVLAAAGPQSSRTALLRQAAADLKQCGGAQRELPCVLSELDDMTGDRKMPRTPARGDLRTSDRDREGHRGGVRDGAGAREAGPAAVPDRASVPAQPGFPAAVRRERPEVEPRPAARLSDAELRVADLASRGHSNRQIAASLFITVSTVEQHLTRVYRKLQVKRRTELSARLFRNTPSQAGATAGR